MESFGPLSLLITGIASILCVVASAVVSWRLGSRSTRPKKPPPSAPPMSDFEIRFAKVEADQAELFSTLQRLTTTMRRLSSRAGMEMVRERKANEPPPPGTPKAQVREFYKLNGLSHVEVAMRHKPSNNLEKGSEE